jgi:hypothetical protein
MVNLTQKLRPSATPLFLLDPKVVLREAAVVVWPAISSHWHLAAFLLVNILTGFGILLFRASGSPDS